ncbi:MAG: ATP-dependent zinc metalloprotease FtsH [bacterium]
MNPSPQNKPRRRPNRPPQGPSGRPSLPGKTAGFWVVLALLVFLAFQLMVVDRHTAQVISYTAFEEQVEAGNLHSLTKTNLKVEGELLEPTRIALDDEENVQLVSKFETTLLTEDPEFPKWVREFNPQAKLVGELPKINWFQTILTYYLPFLLILVLWIFFIRQMQGGGNRAFSFGKSKAKLFNMDKPEITFEDVAGCDEAKVELQEIIEFLRSPKKFQRLGGRIPKGALLVGRPGTGKTLLGRAVAGEAGVPFFSMSGSDFVEMFVGVGASRVRDLFDQGKKSAPCIIFIDEIDAVGRHRGAGLGGGHDEREQTLNQLLVEMDGFESNEGVILLAATNRPDVLDPALLRPGRFDRQIVVDMPDISGREAILKVHMKKVKMDQEVSAKEIASGTPGMCGADLENLVNEAALLAARKNHDTVMRDDFEDAKEKVMLGPERRSRVFTEKQKREIAFHESGHAVVAYNCESADPVHKVTIIPRGQALGLTAMLPEEDNYTWVEQKFYDHICVSLGGRAAEEIFLKRIASGAFADIKAVTNYARVMVTQLGMSEILGPIAFEESSEQVFLGRDYGRRQIHSEKTLQTIDDEVTRIVNDQLIRARAILREHHDKVEIMAEALLDRETLNKEEVDLIMKGQPLPSPDEMLGDTPPDRSSTPDEDHAGEDDRNGNDHSEANTLWSAGVANRDEGADSDISDDGERDDAETTEDSPPPTIHQDQLNQLGRPIRPGQPLEPPPQGRGRRHQLPGTGLATGRRAAVSSRASAGDGDRQSDL